MEANIAFSEEDWQRIERDWRAWWAGELKRPLVMIEVLEPPAGETWPEVQQMTTDFGLDVPASRAIEAYQKRLAGTRWYGDAFPRWWARSGAGVGAAFLGSSLQATPETVWFDPLPEAGKEDFSLEDLELVFDPDNLWWRRVQELTQKAVERWRNQVCVGFTDIGGNLDILASLIGSQRLIFELMDNPDQVLRLTRQITELWLKYYQAQYELVRQTGRGTSPWAAIWSPGRCYMFQSDFAYMISPRMFEKFVLPDLTRLCASVDHGFYHLDGKGQIAHLDMLLAMEDLKGIQWIPGDGQAPPEAWPELLGRIRAAGKLCQLYVNPEGARRIVREHGGEGFALAIRARLNRQEAKDLLEELIYS
jgi:5-methyltetrahydrofolate--homocysteine methyltransferase